MAYTKDTVNRQALSSVQPRADAVCASVPALLQKVGGAAPARSQSAVMDDRATKTPIARFIGSAFVAEREDNDLVIYAVTADPISGPISATMDGAFRLRAEREEQYRRNEKFATVQLEARAAMDGRPFVR